MKLRFGKIAVSSIFCFLSSFLICTASAENGLTKDSITFGSVVALQGKAKGLGQNMKIGLEAAFHNETIQGRKIKILFENDSYEPEQAITATNKLIQQGVFAMIGNVGTPTAKVTLPILAKGNIPAIGFFTGAGLLRTEPNAIINYRASYIQETSAIIDSALSNGLSPAQICAYVQNDAYGMAGLIGIKLAMSKAGASKNIIDSYTEILALTGDNPPRNNIGPVGLYKRNTTGAQKGYNSLKAWEQKSGNKCKLIVTVGAYGSISSFAKFVKASYDNWIISAVSFTGANNFKKYLSRYKTGDKFIMTQVVPLLSSELDIVKEAKATLGKRFGFISLEGYIVGKMTLKIMNDIQGELTREAFIQKAHQAKFDLGGVTIDFTENGYQGSSLVITSYLSAEGSYIPMDKSTWKSLL